MIETIAIGSLCVMGLYAAMGEGMILEFLKHFFERVTNNQVLRHIRPALYECPICMASIWGTVVWVLIWWGHSFKETFSITWLLYVFAVAGLNYILVNLANSDE